MSEENTAEDRENVDGPEEAVPAADGSADEASVPVAPESSNSANESSNDQVQAVVHPEIDASNVSVGPGADISMILDIPVTLSMEIGQTRISISELLKLGKDSVIELQRMADEPMDVLVNGTLVAHGEAVVVGERFGIRLTDVISPQERLRKFT